jgi:uncharacterized protein YicC (UPF0701 family)
MTGYAQSRAAENGWSLRVTIRSVNHRFLDLHLRMPEGFEPLEPRIRQIIRERVRRGHLDVTVYHELAGPAAIGVNHEVAAAYLKAATLLRKDFNASLESELARIEAVLARCMAESLDKLDRMREEEANLLRHEMSTRLRNIAALASNVTALAERARPAFAKRLETRMKELLGETQIDPGRLAQEAALAAERSDVSEELVRLRSHVQQFEGLLASSNEAGKKLDFLLQEMQREANTLLSKTPGNDGDGLEITRIGLEIKSEIEKLREQVQNIE